MLEEYQAATSPTVKNCPSAGKGGPAAALTLIFAASGSPSPPPLLLLLIRIYTGMRGSVTDEISRWGRKRRRFDSIRSGTERKELRSGRNGEEREREWIREREGMEGGTNCYLYEKERRETDGRSDGEGEKSTEAEKEEAPILSEPTHIL